MDSSSSSSPVVAAKQQQGQGKGQGQEHGQGRSILVIGCGISGCVAAWCARQILAGDNDVKIYLRDQARGYGGRLATSRFKVDDIEIKANMGARKLHLDTTTNNCTFHFQQKENIDDSQIQVTIPLYEQNNNDNTNLLGADFPLEEVIEKRDDGDDDHYHQVVKMIIEHFYQRFVNEILNAKNEKYDGNNKTNLFRIDLKEKTLRFNPGVSSNMLNKTIVTNARLEATAFGDRVRDISIIVDNNKNTTVSSEDNNHKLRVLGYNNNKNKKQNNKNGGGGGSGRNYNNRNRNDKTKGKSMSTKYSDDEDQQRTLPQSYDAVIFAGSVAEIMTTNGTAFQNILSIGSWRKSLNAVKHDKRCVLVMVIDGLFNSDFVRNKYGTSPEIYCQIITKQLMEDIRKQQFYNKDDNISKDNKNTSKNTNSSNNKGSNDKCFFEEMEVTFCTELAADARKKYCVNYTVISTAEFCNRNDVKNLRATHRPSAIDTKNQNRVIHLLRGRALEALRNAATVAALHNNNNGKHNNGDVNFGIGSNSHDNDNDNSRIKLKVLAEKFNYWKYANCLQGANTCDKCFFGGVSNPLAIVGDFFNNSGRSSKSCRPNGGGLGGIFLSCLSAALQIHYAFYQKPYSIHSVSNSGDANTIKCCYSKEDTAATTTNKTSIESLQSSLHLSSSSSSKVMMTTMMQDKKQNNNHRHHRVLIVGAGLSGALTCYWLRRMIDEKEEKDKIVAGGGVHIDVLDMARGAGGRMSTTRFGPKDLKANTGAQYISCYTEECLNILKDASSSKKEVDNNSNDNDNEWAIKLEEVNENAIPRSTYFHLKPYEHYKHFKIKETGTNSLVKHFLYAGKPSAVCFETRLQQILLSTTAANNTTAPSSATSSSFMPIFDRSNNVGKKSTMLSEYDIVILAMPPKDILKFFSSSSSLLHHDPQSQADLHRKFNKANNNNNNKGGRGGKNNNKGRQTQNGTTTTTQIRLPNDVIRKLRTPEFIGRYSISLWFDKTKASLDFVNKVMKESTKLHHHYNTKQNGHRHCDGGGDKNNRYSILDAVFPQSDDNLVLVAQSTVEFWQQFSGVHAGGGKGGGRQRGGNGSSAANDLNAVKGGGRGRVRSLLVQAIESLANNTKMPPVAHVKLLNWRTSQVSKSLFTENKNCAGDDDYDDPPVVVAAAENGRLIMTGDWCIESSFEGCVQAAKHAAEACMDAIKNTVPVVSSSTARRGGNENNNIPKLNQGGGTETTLPESAVLRRKRKGPVRYQEGRKNTGRGGGEKPKVNNASISNFNKSGQRSACPDWFQKYTVEK